MLYFLNEDDAMESTVTSFIFFIITALTADSFINGGDDDSLCRILISNSALTNVISTAV